jgi:hypothetical protein
MTRYLIDALAILALAFSLVAAPPARAENGGELLGLLLGIGTVYAIGKGIEQARVRDAEPVAIAETRRTDRLGRWDSRALPRDCLATFQTWHGELRGFERSCLARSMRGLGRLPAMCAVDTRIGHRDATIYSARCLQLEGWEIGRGAEAGWHRGPDRFDGWRRP